MAEASPLDVRSSYDKIAEEYARRIYNELDDKPLDRELLDRFAASVRGAGPVCDLGCGPGHVARYLHERGLDVFGIDLSISMVEIARRLSPGIRFYSGDLRALDLPDGSWSAIVAFYSIIHILPSDLTGVFRELGRVLHPGGSLFLAFHVGGEPLHVEEMWGQAVNFDAYFFRPEHVEDCLKSAGFEVQEVIVRPPYPEVEYQSTRAYVFAVKPACT